MKTAYIDESGNKDIDVPKEGATNFYVVGCILIDSDEQEELDGVGGEISKRFFGGGPIKSSKVGNDDKRRVAVLSAAGDLPGVMYALPIDKRRIDRDSGLAFPRSFYKWVLRHASGELLRTCPDLDVVVDNQGDKDFREGVLGYMKRHYSGELFASSHVRFSGSTESRGVQLADFLAGSVRISFERGTPQLIAPIKDRILCGGPWPSDKFPYHLERELSAEDDEADQRIVSMVDQRARSFIQAMEGEDDEFRKAQVACVRRLLSRFLFDPGAYTPGKVLRRYLAEQVPELSRSERVFRARVVAPARDGGVPIVASSQGYKLPICLREVLRHADQTSVKIVPMVHRLRALRDALSMATDGEVDLFEQEGLGYLRSFDVGVPEA